MATTQYRLVTTWAHTGNGGETNLCDEHGPNGSSPAYPPRTFGKILRKLHDGAECVECKRGRLWVAERARANGEVV